MVPDAPAKGWLHHKCDTSYLSSPPSSGGSSGTCAVIRGKEFLPFHLRKIQFLFPFIVLRHTVDE